MDEKFILQAFKLGAPIVLVSGCYFADCHYIDAEPPSESAELEERTCPRCRSNSMRWIQEEKKGGDT